MSTGDTVIGVATLSATGTVSAGGSAAIAASGLEMRSLPDGWCPFISQFCPIWQVGLGVPVPPGQAPPGARAYAFVVRALLDTGASNTIAERALIERLGAAPTGLRVSSYGADPLGQHETYLIDVSVPFTVSDEVLVLRNVPVTEGALSWGRQESRYQLIIGCDVLSRCRFTVDGERFRLERRSG